MIQELSPLNAKQLLPLMADLGYPNQELINLSQRIETFLSFENSFLFGYFQDEHLVGFGSLSMIPLIHEDGYLWRVSALVVRSNKQGNGIGKKLMFHMEQVAKIHNCIRVELTSSGHRESKAYEFYQKIGYEKFDGVRFIKSL